MLVQVAGRAVVGQNCPVNDHARPEAGPRGVVPARTGSFRFWTAEQRWEWSEEVAALHGYVPGEVKPTTELLLTHKHPDDRAAVADTLARVVETGAPFSSRHRILDTSGSTRHVLVVGDQMRDEAGTVVGTSGYYVDITDTVGIERQAVLAAELPRLVAARELIEQAKGAVMLAYGISGEQAFSVLVWRSQETNTKLREVAENLVAQLPQLGGADTRTRTRFDHLLLTAHDPS
jgi:PAS domain S-box-containing protein